MASTSLDLTVISSGGSDRMQFDAGRLVCCGWVGRDRAALEAHIEELAALGIPRPRQVPIYMNFSTYLLRQDDEVTVVSDQSSGEIEYVLLCRGDRIWVTVGSDQTDRDVETKSIPGSKQMYAKYVAQSCWPFEEVKDHWDQLVLRCWVTHEGRRSLYQEAALGSILGPNDVLGNAPGVEFPSTQGVAIFSGTVATRGGLVFGDAYALEFDDPVLGRQITGSYRVTILPQYV